MKTKTRRRRSHDGHAGARRCTLVSALSLDELVPADHFYRFLDRALDLSFVRDLVHDCYAANKGRPSVDPVVVVRLQLVMFFEGIRAERALLRLAADRLSVRWYLGYNLGEPLPDHSTLTRIRLRYGLAVFRRFFEAIVAQCQQTGLIWGHELYFDATQVQADASLDSLTARFAVEARHHQAHLERAAQQSDVEREVLCRGPQRVQEAPEAPEAVEAHLTARFPQDAEDEAAAGAAASSSSTALTDDDASARRLERAHGSNAATTAGGAERAESRASRRVRRAVQRTGGGQCGSP